MTRLALLFCLFASISLASAQPPPQTIVSETRKLHDSSLIGARYQFKGTVILIAKLDVWIIHFEDKTGLHTISVKPERLKSPITPGDEIEISGTIDAPPDMPTENCTVRILHHGPPPQPTVLTHSDVVNGKALNQYVRIKGVIRDAFRDEIDPDWLFFVLNIGGTMLNVTCPYGALTHDPDAYIGQEVVATGIIGNNSSTRKFSDVVLVLSGTDDIRVIDQKDPFDAPILETMQSKRSFRLEDMGRRRISGFVMAHWRDHAFLLNTDDGLFAIVQIQNGALPACDCHVTVSGLPETDYYRLIISRAVWRPEPTEISAPTLSYRDISPSGILKDELGRLKVDTAAHGQPIRITGIVRHLPSESSNDHQVFIETDGHLISIDIDHIPEFVHGLQLDCFISVSGICLLEYDNNAIPGRFPRIRGFRIVPRSTDDIRILARPSWWSPARLLTLLGFVFAILIGIVVWNISLNRRAKAKGKELADEQIAHVMSELKVNERTRLAVDLHDSMSQTLSGVSMELDAVKDLAGSADQTLNKHLSFAARAIDNCRIELKNCLWDLRSQALDEEDINEAIRKTLHPSIHDDIVTIRFNVPRNRLSDNTMHAILRIIRELVSNAVRHGSATSIKVAGAFEDNTLLFSVADNGCGFDPNNCPGVSQAHFGLEGIRERIEKLDGEVRIASSPATGTKITISIPAPDQQH